MQNPPINKYFPIKVIKTKPGTASSPLTLSSTAPSEKKRSSTKESPGPQKHLKTGTGMLKTTGLDDFDNSEQLEIKSTCDADDVDDANMIADMDQMSNKKQTHVVRTKIQYEKQFVQLTTRSGKKIKSPAYTKGYFKMVKITPEGEKLLKSKTTESTYHC